MAMSMFDMSHNNFWVDRLLHRFSENLVRNPFIKTIEMAFSCNWKVSISVLEIA